MVPLLVVKNWLGPLNRSGARPQGDPVAFMLSSIFGNAVSGPVRQDPVRAPAPTDGRRQARSPSPASRSQGRRVLARTQAR